MEVFSGMEFVFKPLPPAPQLPIGRRKREVSLSELCVNVSILADDVVETDEYFSLVMSSVDPGVTLMPANATVVISDNDCEFTLIYYCVHGRYSKLYLRFRLT